MTLGNQYAASAVATFHCDACAERLIAALTALGDAIQELVGYIASLEAERDKWRHAWVRESELYTNAVADLDAARKGEQG